MAGTAPDAVAGLVVVVAPADVVLALEVVDPLEHDANSSAAVRAPAPAMATARGRRRLLTAQDGGAGGGDPAAGCVHAGQFGIRNLTGVAFSAELLDRFDQ